MTAPIFVLVGMWIFIVTVVGGTIALIIILIRKPRHKKENKEKKNLD